MPESSLYSLLRYLERNVKRTKDKLENIKNYMRHGKAKEEKIALAKAAYNRWEKWTSDLSDLLNSKEKEQ